MRKKSIILAVLVVTVLGGLCWLVLRPREPVYQGRRLSHWLEVYDRKAYQPIDEPRHEKAKEALRQAGTNAIPVLLRMLRAHDSALKLKLIVLTRRQHLINFQFTTADTLNYEAWGAFYDLGTNAWSAVPSLIEVYQQKISPMSQKITALVLKDIGPAAKSAVPVFVLEATRSDSGSDYSGRRLDAIGVLGGIHANPELAVPALIQCLQTNDASIYGAAVRALANYGKDAKAALPALSVLAGDSDPHVRIAAREVIAKIDPEAAAKLPVYPADAVK